MHGLNVVILAAGSGKRMCSTLPKVLHKIGGKPMLTHVIETAKKLNPDKLIIVHGHGGVEVKTVIDNSFLNNDFDWIYQDQQLGTGHALKCALPSLSKDGITLLLYGDVPLISEISLKDMLSKHDDNIVMLTAEFDNSTGYGRIIRNDQSEIIGIVEEKDASQGELFIKEINTGVYLFPNKYLFSWLNNLSNNNIQGEYYATDLIAMGYKENIEIYSVAAKHQYTVIGVNTKSQLEHLERCYQLICANSLLDIGVTLLDKSRIDIRGKVSAGNDCIIDINCIFEGMVQLGSNVKIGMGVFLKNVVIGDNVEILPYSLIEDARIGDNAKIGPFARVRPGTEICSEAHIGNFVEIKNSTIGSGSKVNHLTYIGDATLGSKVNVGAGSVTCNYDGKNKFRTIIDNNAFIGSGSMLVAPVKIGEGSVIGAGSTITKDTPANELTVARATQNTILGWVKIKRNKTY